MTSLENQLKSLWHNYLAKQAKETSVQNKTSPEKDKKFSTEFKFKEPLNHFQCNIKNCLQCCCRNQGQKIRLLLQDLAILLDNGFADKIEGKYDTETKVKEFLNKPVAEKVYNTPYLKRKKGNDGLEECIFLNNNLECTIWDKAPLICKSYPLIMDQVTTPEKMVLTFSLDKQCSCTREDQMKELKPKEYTQNLINSSICERIEADHTTKLLVYERDKLKEIGFENYL